MIKQLQTILSFVIFLTTAALSQDQLSILIGDIKSTPPVYLSAEASAYYEKTGQPSASGNKDDALRGYRAAIKLGDMGSSATPAIPTLIDQFPKAVHISEIKSVRYSGEGTFDDWLSTYVMNEKNKFILASPFLDYNSISICEQYIDAVPQVTFIERTPLSGATIKSATVNITITITFYIGSCTLSRITGVTLGNTQDDWRNWWAQNGSGISATPTPVSPAVISSGQAFADIVVKGKYRMSLTTGDELIGFVESKDDTSLIFETTEGKPYIFNRNLIERYDLIELPKTTQKPSQHVNDSVEIVQQAPIPVAYDDLVIMNRTGMLLEVKISNGSLFTGNLVSVDSGEIRINVQGSIIPISKNVVDKISIIPPPATKPLVQKPSGPFDTLIVKSNKVDDWGKSQPDIILYGFIKSESNDGITIKDTSDKELQIKQADIVRVIKHTQDNSDEAIKRYAKPLSCPSDMVLIDLPPGTQKRPFFKTCIDKYEYPNKEGAVPQANTSYESAKKLCEQQGKRLCTAEEWQWACSSLDGLPYPYGKTFDEQRCNSDASRAVEPSGTRINCFSRFGAFDMVGNVFEWVSTTNKQPALMGGPYSKCQTVSPGLGGEAKPISGLRCCKSN